MNNVVSWFGRTSLLGAWQFDVASVGQKRHATLALLVGAILTACGAPAAEDETVQTESLSSPLAFYSSGPRVPQRDASRVQLKVCWLTGGTATQRANVRAGAELWSTATENWLQFSGWDSGCVGGEDIQLKFVKFPANAKNVACGSYDDRIDFVDDGNSNYQKFCGAHEFGHHLGFSHEHLRLDGSRICTGDADPQPARGGTPDFGIGSNDEQSVMSYCSGIRLSLSPDDVAGVKKLYGGGSPITHGKYYALRYQDGRYLTIAEDASGITRRTHLVDHDTGQRWVLKVTRQAGAGNVMYGDKIALSATRATVNPEAGAPTIPYYICPNGNIGMLPCWWWVDQTGGGGGASTVDVNDPFQLTDVDFKLLLQGGEPDSRFTGDFGAPEYKTFSGSPDLRFSIAGVSKRLQATQATATQYCIEKGYVGGRFGKISVQNGSVYEFMPTNESSFPAKGDWIDSSSSVAGVISSITCAR